MGRLAAACAGMRDVGAAALWITYVAAGRFDVFAHQLLSPWDIAAPGMIANYTSKGRTFTMRAVAMGSRCTPAYYLDGVRWYPLDQDPIIELEKFIPLRDLVGVEVYTGGAATPAQFDPNTGCGAVVFWTKH